MPGVIPCWTTGLMNRWTTGLCKTFVAILTFDYHHVNLIQTSSPGGPGVLPSLPNFFMFGSSASISSSAEIHSVIFLKKKKKIFFQQEKFAVAIVNAFSKISLRLSEDTRYKNNMGLLIWSSASNVHFYYLIRIWKEL